MGDLSSRIRPYVYRRELGARMLPSEPDLCMSSKIARTEGLCFRSTPIFKHLHELPVDDQISGMHTIESFQEAVDDIEEDEEELNDLKKKKKAPSVSEMREQMRMMITFYEDKFKNSIRTVYPLIGPAGEHADEDREGGGSSENKSKKKK